MINSDVQTTGPDIQSKKLISLVDKQICNEHRFEWHLSQAIYFR